jgi:MFS family permease
VPGFRVLSLLETPRPRRVAMSPRAATLVVATVCVGAFMGQLDASIVSAALPRLARGVHAGVGAVEWVSLIYVLVLVALLAPVGAWADAVGRKSLYVGGFALFTAASAGCAIAADLPVLLACRAAQAVGAALLQANSVALIADAVGSRRLGRAVGVQAAAQAVGLAAGPAVGGWLLAVGSWRLLFLVNVPMGVIGCLSGAALLPRSRHLAPFRRIGAGALLGFIAAVASLLLALSLLTDGRRRGALLVAAVAAVVAAILIHQQGRTQHPLVARALARAPGVRGGLLAGFLAYAALFGTLVVVPLYLSRQAGTQSPALGLELAALPIGLGVLAPLAGSWADRRPTAVATGGLSVATLCLVALAVTRPTGSAMVGLLAALGGGLGTFMPANNRRLMAAAPAGTTGAAAGLLNMARGLGTAVGTAIAVGTFTCVSGAAGDAAAGSGFSVASIGLAACCAVGAVAGRR